MSKFIGVTEYFNIGFKKNKQGGNVTRQYIIQELRLGRGELLPKVKSVVKVNTRKSGTYLLEIED